MVFVRVKLSIISANKNAITSTFCKCVRSFQNSVISSMHKHRCICQKSFLWKHMVKTINIVFFSRKLFTPPPPLWTYGWGRIKQKSRLSCTIIRQTKSAICGFIGSRAIVWIPVHINQSVYSYRVTALISFVR